jgi:hypothetical protein
VAAGIVLELQRDCLDGSVSASAILRKAKAIAVKLDLKELSDWIDQELNGYECALKDLPEHRTMGGAPKFWNPYNGWCPIIPGDKWLSDILTTAYLPNPIVQLEKWASGKDGTLTYRFPHAVQAALREMGDFEFEAVMHISTSQIVSALDFVRNKILSWTLELEKKGITGDGYTFKESQKQQAQVITNHIYGGNIGVLGNVGGDANNSRFVSAQGVHEKELLEFLDQAEPASAGLDAETRSTLTPLLEKLREAVQERKPPSKISGLITSLRNVLEGASGNIVAAALLAALIGR